MRFATTNQSVGAREPGAEALVKALEAARESVGDVSFVSIHSVGRQSDDVESAVQGRFRIGDRGFRLESPIDWAEKPYAESDARAFFLNSFVFADPVLASPDFSRALPELIRVFLDWLGANPRVGEPGHRYSWHDHAAAGRLVYLAYVLREGVGRRLVDGRAARRLATGVLDHVDYLIADENYAAHYNHGLFADAALAIAARTLEPYEPARRWREVGSARFRKVLGATVDAADALHLEHSPYYHWIIHGAISRFSEAAVFEGLDLPDLVRRMEESGSWLVAPDGTLPPFGDTPWGAEPPASVKRDAEANSGLRVFGSAGYAAVRRRGSCLIVTAAHHPTAHKHADDCSFCLYEDGLPIVIDAGDPGHDYGSADRRYGTSPAAHATISIDDHDWVTEGGGPYGSGMIAAAEHEGIHALLAVNPGAVPGGGEARRLFAYSPASFLIVIDLVEATSDQTLRRHVPLAPDLTAAVSPEGRIGIRRDGDEIATLVSFCAGDVPPEGVEVSVGRRVPQLGGWYYPGPGDPAPRCSIAFVGPGGHPRALALTPGTGGPPAPAPVLSCSNRDGLTELEVTGVDERPVRLRTDGRTLELSRPGG